MRKVVPFLVLLLALGLTGCKKHYLEGFADGETQGYDNGYGDGYGDGHDEGYQEGWEDAKDYFASADYLQGFADGKDEGLTIGYNNGYSDGNADGLTQGYNNGYSDGHSDGTTTGYNSGYGDGFADGENQGYNNGYGDGYNDGYDDGYDDGLDPLAIQAAYDQGYNDGYDDGYDDGYFDGDSDGYTAGYDTGFNDSYTIGFNDGYDFGFDDGYDLGFDDGFDVGFDDGYGAGYYDGINGFSNPDTFVAAKDLDGLPNNNAVNLNKYVKVASLALNDVVNFKRVKKLERAYLDGLKASANVLEETSASSKDLAKLATLKEQFRINTLAKEIRSQYALSADRSQKVAKLATSFRKLANTRAITESDAEAFSTELLGVSVKKIENAYMQTLKGNMGDLKTVVKQSAEANEISELHATKLMLKLFL
jgi:flagellar biosynthesis/type III secretory pathway protein FliH/gas vesicle protein